jgi:hypothetical protein
MSQRGIDLLLHEALQRHPDDRTIAVQYGEYALCAKAVRRALAKFEGVLEDIRNLGVEDPFIHESDVATVKLAPNMVDHEEFRTTLHDKARTVELYKWLWISAIGCSTNDVYKHETVELTVTRVGEDRFEVSDAGETYQTSSTELRNRYIGERRQLDEYMAYMYPIDKETVLLKIVAFVKLRNKALYKLADSRVKLAQMEHRLLVRILDDVEI